MRCIKNKQIKRKNPRKCYLPLFTLCDQESDVSSRRGRSEVTVRIYSRNIWFSPSLSHKPHFSPILPFGGPIFSLFYFSLKNYRFFKILFKTDIIIQSVAFYKFLFWIFLNESMFLKITIFHFFTTLSW